MADLTLGSLSVRVIPVAPLSANCCVIAHTASKQCIITDCGGDAQHVANAIKELNLEPRGIVFTHGHFDHILGAGDLRKLVGNNVPMMIHKADEPLWNATKSQCRNFGQRCSGEQPPVDRFLKEGDKVLVGDSTGVVIETPGHTQGGICLYFEKEKLLIAGDTLFRESFGRTDLAGGDEDVLFASLKKLFQLPEDVTVVTGHGELTDIAWERKHNMYFLMSR